MARICRSHREYSTPGIEPGGESAGKARVRFPVSEMSSFASFCTFIFLYLDLGECCAVVDFCAGVVGGLEEVLGQASDIATSQQCSKKNASSAHPCFTFLFDKSSSRASGKAYFSMRHHATHLTVQRACADAFNTRINNHQLLPCLTSKQSPKYNLLSLPRLRAAIQPSLHYRSTHASTKPSIPRQNTQPIQSTLALTAGVGF